MLYFIVILGVVNLLIGFGAALALEHITAPDGGGATFFEPTPAEVADTSPATTAPTSTFSPTGMPDLPPEWVEAMADGPAYASSAEGVVAYIGLGLQQYRDRLAMSESSVREHLIALDPEAVTKVLEEFMEGNNQWLETQKEVLAFVQGTRGAWDGHESVMGDIESSLLDQSAQITTMAITLDLLDLKADFTAGCEDLVVEIVRLLKSVHALRDQLHTDHAQVLRIEGRLADVDTPEQVDPLTGLSNRIGLDAHLQKCWKDDPDRKRPLSIAMFDIDRFARFNREHGTATGDRLLSAQGDVARGLLRKDRGDDFPSRYGGQSIAIVLSETDVDNALTPVERMRLTFENTTFQEDGQDLNVSVSCAVLQVKQHERLESIFKRLERAIREAKVNGGNCTIVDRGPGPEAVPVSSEHLKTQTVDLAAVKIEERGAGSEGKTADSEAQEEVSEEQGALSEASTA
jgi:diguanylate cyclase (GGDEF)-like protein